MLEPHRRWWRAPQSVPPRGLRRPLQQSMPRFGIHHGLRVGKSCSRPSAVFNQPRVTNSKSWPSTLATRAPGPGSRWPATPQRPLWPQVDPPTPMLMTSVNGHHSNLNLAISDASKGKHPIKLLGGSTGSTIDLMGCRTHPAAPHGAPLDLHWR